jgi:hypothetical protein
MSNLILRLPCKTISCFTLTLALLAVAGCKTASGPGSASFASVVIEGKTPEQIHDAAAKVFRKDGYEAYQVSPTRLVFEKEASRLTTISRDGLVAAQAGARTLDRVRSELVSLGEGSYRLQCEAFAVTGAGDSFFEEEVRKTNLRAGPYRSLLNKVKKELTTAP